MAKKIGGKSCQSNFDKGSSDFGSFLAIHIKQVTRNKSRESKHPLPLR